jgi:hypothetical protein
MFVLVEGKSYQATTTMPENVDLDSLRIFTFILASKNKKSPSPFIKTLVVWANTTTLN